MINVTVTRETHARLRALANYGETMDLVITKLLDSAKGGKHK